MNHTHLLHHTYAATIVSTVQYRDINSRITSPATMVMNVALCMHEGT